MAQPSETTRVLHDAEDGDRSAWDRLFELVYDELHALAERHMSHERRDHTLQATALVHEAYLRLVDEARVGWSSRAHFLAVASEVVRRVLVDHARRRGRAKRGGGRHRIRLTEDLTISTGSDTDVLVLDEALNELGQLDDRQSKVVQLRYFGGLTIEQTAQVLGTSVDVVKTDWRAARAWLGRRLRQP
jgi:RNA polymerase sigma factor (TIGR02999 family)